MRYLLTCCLFLLFLCSINIAEAKTDAELDKYLATHRYTFRINPDSSLSFTGDGMQQMLLDKMKGKSLFVYGEGWSHFLKTNGHVILAVAQLFAGHGLKQFFSEAARSWAVRDNIFYHLSDKSAIAYYTSSYYDSFFRMIKNNEKTIFGDHISYSAVDFERRQTFWETLNIILPFVDEDKKTQLYQLAPYFGDSSYLHLSGKEFVKWYRQRHDAFNKDSIAFKSLMGKVYPYFSYLMGDPEPSAYRDNRDKEMAAHLLMQIQPLDTNAIYFYDCGQAHSRIGKRQGLNRTAVHHLADSKILHNRIVVMNLYGENNRVPGDNWALKFMKGAVKQSFKQAANAPIVVFDLSGLPKKYQYIVRKYGQLLVYVQGQR